MEKILELPKKLGWKIKTIPCFNALNNLQDFKKNSAKRLEKFKIKLYHI